MRIGYSLALIATLCAAPALAQPVPEIREIIDSRIKAGDLHGAVLVADRNGVIVQAANGMADRDARIPNTPQTKFRIGSITKQFTAMLVLQQAAKGTLGLDDTITRHLPWYRKDTGDRITIRQLLNHASGLPDLVPDFSKLYERQPYGRRDFITRFASGDLRFAPGERFAYSNSGYYILGAILETATKQSYGALLAADIFAPAGMTESSYSEDIPPGAALGYARGDGKAENLQPAAPLDPTIPFAMGGIRSTVGDLYKWDRALNAGRLLPPAMMAQLYVPLPGQTYTNGWINYSIELPNGGKLPVTMHQGSINGFSGVIFRDRARQSLVVILNNVGSNGSEWRFGEALMGLLAR